MRYAVLLLILFQYGSSYAQNSKSISINNYFLPVDTLYNNELPLNKKIIIDSIRKWQSFSNSRTELNCQFFPSCSNYFALSIIKHNSYLGFIKGCDRILRCNGYAKFYHDNNTFNPSYSHDGRMIDELYPVYNPNPSKNSIFSTFLSIIPGAGRAYSGRFIDGLISFSTTVLLLQATYIQHNKNNFFLSFALGTMSLTFWLSDFYGAYRTAKVAI